MTKTAAKRAPGGKKKSAKPRAEEASRKIEPHFDGNRPGAKIHTSRGGTCAKGSCDHQSNCDTSKLKATGVPTSAKHNSHHVLPISAVSGYLIDKTYSKKVTAIHAIYRDTDWCINQSPNLIALALKSTFRHYPAVRDIDLPAHNFHHNCEDGYTDEVTDAIADSIWRKIAEASDSGGKKHFTAKQTKAQLEKLATRFRKLLGKRGQRRAENAANDKRGKKGTEAAWKGKGDLAYWYLALSMASTKVAKEDPSWCP